MCGHSRYAGMYWINHWIPRPAFQTRLYHLHPCRRACAGMTEEMDFGFRRAVPGILGGLFLSPLSFQRKLACIHAGRPESGPCLLTATR